MSYSEHLYDNYINYINFIHYIRNFFATGCRFNNCFDNYIDYINYIHYIYYIISYPLQL